MRTHAPPHPPLMSASGLNIYWLFTKDHFKKPLVKEARGQGCGGPAAPHVNGVSGGAPSQNFFLFVGYGFGFEIIKLLID